MKALFLFCVITCDADVANPAENAAILAKQRLYALPDAIASNVFENDAKRIDQDRV